MFFSANLKYLREKSGMDQLELAKKLGKKSRSSVSEWEKGSYTPKMGTLRSIADIFNVSIDDLMEVDLSNETPKSKISVITATCSKLTSVNQDKVIDYSEHLLKEQEHPNDTVKEVQFVGYSAAGTEPESYCAEPFVEYTVTDKLKADAFVVLTGDSMEPRFHKGEPVFYRSQANIENGEFAIVDIDGEGAICKQIKIDYDNHKIILHSLNPKYEDIIMDPTRIRILGKVIE